MSLLAWFPLNGDFKNQGLADISLDKQGTIDYTAGKVTAQSASFSGSNGNYLYGNINLTNTMSFACWIKFNSTSGYHIIDCRTAAGDGYQPIYAGINYGLQWHSSQSGSLNISANDCDFITDTWYHIAVTTSPNESKVYINGVLKGQSSTVVGYNFGQRQLRLGTRCTGANWFNGSINDLRIYDHVLSSTEIKKLAQGLTCHFSFNFEDFYTPVDYIDQVNPAAGATSEHNRCEINDIQYDYIETKLNVKGKGTYGGIILSKSWWTTWEGQSSSGVNMSPSSFSEDTWTNVTYSFPNIITGLNTSGWGDTTNYWTPQHLKIAYIKTYKNGELTGDFIPCVRNYDYKPGLYDLVNNKFYTNQGSGADFEAPYYARIEYVESTRAQRVKLNIIPTNEYKIEETFSLTDTSVTSCLWCARGSSTSDHTITAFYIGNTGLRCDYGISSPNNQYAGSLEINQIHTLKYDSNKWYLDDIEKIAPTVESFTAGNKIELFSSYWGGEDANIDNGAKIKMYSFKVWDSSGILVCDLIPVIDLIIDEPGLYDMIEGKFYRGLWLEPLYAPSLNTYYMSDCSGYSIDAEGINVEDSKGTAWGNSCSVFNGVNSQIIGSYKTNGLTNLTYAAWVCQTARTPERACICIGGTYLTIDDSGRLSGYAYGKSPAGYHTGSKIIPLNQWTHIAITWDDEYIHGYINGTEDFKVACTGTFSYAVNQQIGMEGSSSRAFNGKIADLRIYSTALSAEDIKELYENRIEIDSNKNLFCGNIVERDGIIELTKENVLSAESFGEDSAIRIEGIDSEINSDIYDRLEYIESNGTQYIQTGIKGTAKWTHTIQFTKLNVRQLMGMNGSGGNYWGVSNANATRGTQDGDYETYNVWSGHPKAGNKDIIIDDFGETDSNIYRYLNGELKNNGTISGDVSDTEYKILALGTNSFCCYARLYNTTCEQNGELVRNFIPVKHKIDNEIGLFDTVTQEFYNNSGSGNFIAGPVVKKSFIAKHFIEE